MTISLYEATVERFLQGLGAMSGVLERGLSHCADNNRDPQELVEARLFADMLPFSFQVVSVAHHSLGAVEAVQGSGVFSPRIEHAHSYAELQKLIADTQQKLSQTTAAEIDALIGREAAFQFGERRLPFTAEGFLLSFSLPNFYFHAATAYDILRAQGVPLGKRDFMGRLRMKT